MSDWTRLSACKDLEGMEKEIFFPPSGDQGAEAKQICSTCPVVAECLDFALRTREDHGIWGGLNATERRRLKQGPEVRFRQCEFCKNTFSFVWDKRPGYKAPNYCNDTCRIHDRREKKNEWRRERKRQGLSRV